MEYLEFMGTWLAGNPGMVTAWTIVILLVLVWLLRGHRASKQRAVFKPRSRIRAEQAKSKVAGTVRTPKSHRRGPPPR